MDVIKPPESIKHVPSCYAVSILLAGSIEQDKAERWQDRVEDIYDPEPGVILNPRRDEWDSSWEQKITNPHFYEQVTWELDALEIATFILMYFQADTKSPISLLELGLHANSSKLIVACPDGFWRKGNVEILCQRYNIPLYGSLDLAIGHLNNSLRAWYGWHKLNND